MLWKCCTQYASKFGKLSSGYRTGKGQFSFQSQRKAISKNAHTTIQLHSFHMQIMLRILQARLQQYMNHEIPDVKAGFRKGRGTRDQIDNIHWIIEKAGEFQENIYFCFIEEKAMGTDSSTLAWKILWTEEPGKLQSMGSQRVGHNWVTELNWTELSWTYRG